MEVKHPQFEIPNEDPVIQSCQYLALGIAQTAESGWKLFLEKMLLIGLCQAALFPLFIGQDKRQGKSQKVFFWLLSSGTQGYKW